MCRVPHLPLLIHNVCVVVMGTKVVQSEKRIDNDTREYYEEEGRDKCQSNTESTRRDAGKDVGRGDRRGSLKNHVVEDTLEENRTRYT
jgi:hypothetical protein